MESVPSALITIISMITKSAVKSLLNAKNSIEVSESVSNAILGMRYIMDNVCLKI